MILGLDVSTSCTGYALLDDEGNQIEIGYINLKKYKSLFAKAFIVETKLIELRDKHVQDNKLKICIEQSLQMFKSGFSSAKVLNLLARFNGIVSYLCFNIFKVEPDYISATSARKKAGITIIKGKNSKLQVADFYLAKGQQVEYTKTGKIKPECFDMLDALVISDSQIKSS